MRYLTFSAEKATYPIALLVRYLSERELKPYVQGMEEDVVALSITTPQKAKTTEIRAYIDELLPKLIQMQTDYVIVTDGALFKALTKVTKVDSALGYVLPCKIKNYEFINLVYVPSPKQVLYDPSLFAKVQQGLTALSQHRANKYIEPGSNIVHFEEYPQTWEEILIWLRKLVDKDLAIDIEGFDLKHHRAGIGTISMAWNQHEGIAFPVDLGNDSSEVRWFLKEFFLTRAKRKKTKTFYHNASYDVYVLVYQLFMDNLLDTEGLLKGLDTLLEGFIDTMLVTYLATNSCAGNHLSLKYQAQEFAGDYAVEVKDITKVPLPDLLRYNLIDSLSTWYVYNKHWDTMVADDQLPVYEDLFQHLVKDIIQMQLTGLPIHMPSVIEGKKIMQADAAAALKTVMESKAVGVATQLLNERWVEKRNSELKVKRVSLADAKEVFNLNSPQQLQLLLYTVMGLPVISYTDTKQPSTDGDTLKALRNHTQDPEHLAVLNALLDFSAVDKILNSFVPAFESAVLGPDGHHYLFGFFNLGGTLSGRLSSNNPNLQNIPATGSKYAKLVKNMFRAPKGWIFAGLDFNSLEDRISALTTKDPNKLKVYTDGYDGHSLRAFYYFRDQMPDITEDVASINSIQKKYPQLRQLSKAPTFALTYQGTFRTLMVNCGFSEEVAKAIEANYHKLYAVSDQWVADKLNKASQTGYVTVAFGLRIRTPLLKQVIRGTRSTPYEAEAEGRSAGNALGQSYGLLNSRAVMAFMKKVRQSVWRLSIKPCAQIHDASYYLVRDDVNLLGWMNRELVKEVEWQELPEIQHPEVKLGGELSIFYPSWASEITIPNGADSTAIRNIVKEKLSQ